MVAIQILLSVAVTTPAFAAPLQQGGGSGDFGLSAIIDSLVGLITTLAKPLAVLGLAGWGLGKFAAPFAPEINSKFQNYGQNLVFGAVLVLFSAQIADWLFSIGG